MTATRADHCPFSDPRSAAQALWMEDDPGFFGGERLISYDPGKMRTITACFVHCHLTLFASNEAFLMHAGWLAYAISLALILTYIDEDQKYSKVALGLFDGAMLEFRVLPHVVVSLSSSGSTTTPAPAWLLKVTLAVQPTVSAPPVAFQPISYLLATASGARAIHLQSRPQGTAFTHHPGALDIY